MVDYLEEPIVEMREKPLPMGTGLTVFGYTLRKGAPTAYLVRIASSPRWYRLKCWCFSNASTMFVTIKGVDRVVTELPPVPGKRGSQ